jgi:uncharacterized lipoprotein YehR (DUF1307 family)
MKTIAILALKWIMIIIIIPIILLLLAACDQQDARPFNPSDLDSIDQRVIEQLNYIDDVIAEELDLIDEKIDYQAVAERWANSYSYLYIDWDNTVYVSPWE